MKITIITINLNNAEGLNDTIQSVKNQSFSEKEFIIIDGASNDNSINTIKASAKDIDYWVSEKDSGMYEAMNKGILKSSGEYLLFLNSGDTLSNNEVIKTAVASFKNEEIIFGNINILHKGKICNTVIYPDFLNFNYFITGAIPHQGMFIKKSVFSRVGLYSEQLRICSDWKFQLDCICKYKCSYKHLNLIISDFAGGGISAREENNVQIKTEKESVLLNEYFLLKDDLHLMQEYKKLAFYHQYSSRIKLLRKLRLLKPILSGKFLFNYNTKEGF